MKRLTELVMFSTLTGLLMSLGSLIAPRQPVTQKPQRRIGSGHELIAAQMAPAASGHAIEERVAAEYREMPGMRLTAAQAARLFALDADTATSVLARLCGRGVLAETREGQFVLRG